MQTKKSSAKGFFAIKMLSFWAGRTNLTRSTIFLIFFTSVYTFFVLPALPSGENIGIYNKELREETPLPPLTGHPPLKGWASWFSAPP